MIAFLRHGLKCIAAVIVAATCAPSAAAGDAPTLASLIDKLLASEEGRERRSACERIAAHSEWTFEAVYRELREGRVYRPDVKVGLVERSRRNSNGQEHPYLLAIPKGYTATRRYPVRVYLHGGVTRPTPDTGTPLQRDRERLLHDDRISVLPAGWEGSKWWQASQVENVTAILREIKRDYDVDENRVSLTGTSDGGTGAWYFAFRCPTPWAAYLPFIGSPSVLANPSVGAEGSFFLFNVLGKRFLVINGSADTLYPAESERPVMELFEKVGAEVTFEIEEGGGHDTRWLPRRSAEIDAFVESHPRDPLPDHVFWATERTDRANRSSWVVIDALTPKDDCAASGVTVIGKPPRRCGGVDVKRAGNVVDVVAQGVDRYRLLLSPEKFDLDADVVVHTNGGESFHGRVSRSVDTLLKWAAEDVDRSMLFAAELEILVPPGTTRPRPSPGADAY